MKVHTCIHGNEGAPCDVEFTSAATHGHFMLCPGKLSKGDLLTIDRAYIDYAKFEKMTQRSIIYVTKMKQNLTYEVTKSICYIDVQGFLEHPERDWEESLAAMMESPPEASDAENSSHTRA